VHDHLPTPAGHTISDTSQDAVGLLGHLGTLLAHLQAAVDQNPQALFHQAAFQPLLPKPVALHGVVLTQVQDPAFEPGGGERQEPEHELAMCACSPECQRYPGMHQKKHGQQGEAGDSATLLCSGETSSGVLCPALEPSVQDGHGPV